MLVRHLPSKDDHSFSYFVASVLLVSFEMADEPYADPELLVTVWTWHQTLV